MKLTDQEMLVAATAQLQRDQSIASLAKQAGIAQHSFMYALKRLQERGVLRPWVFVNPFQMGYEEYELLFTIGAGVQPQLTSFKVHLENHPQVIWYGSLGASYQFGVRIIAKGAYGCQQFLDDLEQKFRAIILRKSVSSILSFTSLPKRYLAADFLTSRRKVSFPPGIEIAPFPEVQDLDNSDFKILRALIQVPLASEREIARMTSLARGTVSARIQNLKQTRVLLGAVYHVSARSFDYQAYRLLISGKGLNRALKKHIMKFAQTDASVVNVTHCLGAWDFELSIEVKDPAHSASKVSMLYQAGDGLIDQIELIPVFEQGISYKFLNL